MTSSRRRRPSESSDKPHTDGPSPTRDAVAPARWESALAGWQRYIILLLVVVSVALRIVYFAELSGGPCAVLHRYPESDMNFFDLWAQRIAGGDWLTDAALHPLHGWHLTTADGYFTAHPERLAEFTGRAGPDGATLTPAQALWNHWYAEKQFHQEPLYPYLIALTYKLFGPDVRWVFAWQMALGVLTNVLVYLVTRRHFGYAAAAVAGLLVVLNGPLLFFEMVLLRTSLEAFATIGLVWLLDRAWFESRKVESRKPKEEATGNTQNVETSKRRNVQIGGNRQQATAYRWAAFGVGCGLAVLLKMTFVLLPVVVVAVLAWKNRRALPRLVRPLLTMAAGFAVCLMPAVARNLIVGAPALSLSSVGPVTFVGANVVDTTVSTGFHAGLTHLPDIMGASDGRFLPAVRETLRTHPGAGSYLALLGRKFARLWHWYEIPNNVNYYLFQEFSGVLRALPVTFTIIGPAALAGMLLTLPRLRREGRGLSLYLMIAAGIVPLIGFYLLSRFRTPLTVVLTPFAAWALVTLIGGAAGRRWREAGLAALLFAATGIMVWQPLDAGRTRTLRGDYEGLYAAYYGPLHQQAEEAGDFTRAAEVLGELAAHQPRILSPLGPMRRAASRDEAGLCAFFAQVLDGRGRYLLAAGQTAGGEASRRRGAELQAAATGW